ncbi:MAG: glycosyltransferase family 4 protein [Crocinitomicaceae bacterium]
MKAKLGYLCSSESWGGLEMNHVRNAEWMQVRGHNVVLICVKDSPIEKFAISKSIEVLSIDKHKKYYDFNKSKTLAKLISNLSISHLIVRSTYDISIASNVKRYLKDSIHTSYFMEMQLGVKKTNLLHTLRYKYIDLWSCPLEWLKIQVEEWTNFKNKLVVIPSGLDLSQFASLNSVQNDRKSMGIDGKVLVFGLIGRFDIKKGQLLLLNAMTKCSNNNFSVALLGEPTKNEGNTYFEEIQLFISEHKLEDRVSIHPFRENTTSFYNAIDWLVMATKAETFGMVTIESLACGTPVLGSNAGGTPEILNNEKGGLLFETQNSNDLAKKIDLICEKQTEFDSSILKAMAQQYDHHSVCEMIEKAFEI